MNMGCHQQVTSTCRTSQARRERRLKVHGNGTQTAPKQGESIAFVSVQSKDLHKGMVRPEPPSTRRESIAQEQMALVQKEPPSIVRAALGRGREQHRHDISRPHKDGAECALNLDGHASVRQLRVIVHSPPVAHHLLHYGLPRHAALGKAAGLRQSAQLLPAQLHLSRCASLSSLAMPCT